MKPRTGRLVGPLMALAAAALLLAACGVANPFAPASAKQTASDQALKFTQCMRQHGVNLPDPNSNGQIFVGTTGGGGYGGGGPVTNGRAPADSGNSNGPGTINSAQFQAAQSACQHFLPNGGQGSRGPSQQVIDQATKFSQCMRQHGIDMPDPQVQGGGITISGSPGAFDPSSDQFKQAQQACRKYMPGATNGGS